MSPMSEGRIEYLVETRWALMDAVRGFAGANPSQAVLEPEAQAALLDFESHVAHFEVLERIEAAS